MGKIYVRLKDKSSTYWITEQDISLVGELPKQVEKTQFVSNLLKHGVIEIVSEDFAKKFNLSDSEKEEAKKEEQREKDLNDLIDAALERLDEKNVTLAKQIIDKIEKEYGQSDRLDELKKAFESKIETMEEEAEALEVIKELIEKSLEAKIIIKDESGYSIDGKIIAETDEELVGYLTKSKKVRNTIEKKLANPKE